jgi:hypothetical protein
MGVAKPIAKGMLLHNAWSLCQSSSPWASERVWLDSGGLHLPVGLTIIPASPIHTREWCGGGVPWDWSPPWGRSQGVCGNKVPLSLGSLICRSEHKCLCGPILVSSAGDAGCSDSGFTDPECWLILRSHKGCRLLWIAGRWP